MSGGAEVSRDLEDEARSEHGVPEESIEQLRERILSLEKALNDARSQKFPEEQPEIRPRPVEPGAEVAPIQEGDLTLRRLIQRIAMILQADKIAIMFYDQERGELIGIPPSYGLDESHINRFRVRATQGIAGDVFRTGEPVIFHDAPNDPRTKKDMISLMHVHNGISVPLVIEKRDDENRIIDRTTIGVLHAFNKRHGEDFNDEDVRLLERLAKNVGSIIANQQLYKEVVEQREELLRTFESLSSGLMLVSPEKRINQVNAVARSIFRLDEDAIGKELDKAIKNKKVTKLLKRGLKGDEPEPIEFSETINGIEHIFHLQVAQVASEERVHGAVSIINDVTEQRNLDRMKSSFVAMASHELRTPLTAIKGFVSTLINDDTFEPDERREFYQIIDHECDRLTRLINDLLNTARIEANESLRPNYTQFDLQELVDKVVMIQKLSAENHEIFVKIADRLPVIIGDQDKIDQILTNLLSNAVKYSPSGGDVIVHGSVDVNWIMIGVEDQGIGIAPDHLGMVFEKFHRVNNEDNRKIYGTGLGLFLVKHLVEQIHLGEIWVESQVGVGSTFWFKIPRNLNIEKAKELNQ